MRTHAATRLLALILSLAAICRSHEFKPVWIHATDRHTRRFVAATCRSDVSKRFVVSCVSAFTFACSRPRACVAFFSAFFPTEFRAEKAKKTLLTVYFAPCYCHFQNKKKSLVLVRYCYHFLACEYSRLSFAPVATCETQRQTSSAFVSHVVIKTFLIFLSSTFQVCLGNR